ncbi:GtrA family protein [Dictyobacter formicarum]|uniref:GtrA/DPMS transmembrane domain-containing protein n=1 Tax=Dictyobacter formicarum TaxID=2778368 RepID=A0ABQ3VN54_9CHLR|nr:GtrA family protein [Dictyobacter formicarum]GHO87262.1 hypothetical protein KSZ_52680 [Dictyobacter formicarum]
MQYVTIAKTPANLCILKKRRSSIFAFFSTLVRKKFVRFAVIGGIGILFNDLVLAGFMWLIHFYPAAYVFAFAVSNGLNFVLNQVITYPEHLPNRASIWFQRLLKAEITSVSALVISFSVALIFHYIFHMSEYLANPIGLCFSFVYKYLVSDRFVYRPGPARSVAPEAEPVTDPMTPPVVDEDAATSAAD